VPTEAQPQPPATKKAAAAKTAAAAPEGESPILGRIPPRRGGDVDSCEVGYVTVRLGGCLVRPIVVAIAAVPPACGAYCAGCSCSCC
jgi:hypothetical protein